MSNDAVNTNIIFLLFLHWFKCGMSQAWLATRLTSTLTSLVLLDFQQGLYSLDSHSYLFVTWRFRLETCLWLAHLSLTPTSAQGHPQVLLLPVRFACTVTSACQVHDTYWTHRFRHSHWLFNMWGQPVCVAAHSVFCLLLLHCDVWVSLCSTMDVQTHCCHIFLLVIL